LEVQKVIIEPAVQWMVTGSLGVMALGVLTVVKLTLSQRRDVKKLLTISEVFSQNINTLNPCMKKILSVARFHNTAIHEVVRQDDETAIQSLRSAMDDIKEVECMLDKRYDANSEAAMAVGGGR